MPVDSPAGMPPRGPGAGVSYHPPGRKRAGAPDVRPVSSVSVHGHGHRSAHAVLVATFRNPGSYGHHRGTQPPSVATSHDSVAICPAIRVWPLGVATRGSPYSIGDLMWSPTTSVLGDDIRAAGGAGSETSAEAIEEQRFSRYMRRFHRRQLMGPH